MTLRTDCKCMHPPLDYRDYDLDPASDIFGDDRNGGEITVEKCKHCSTKWLRYFVEYPAFTASGRWCRGVVTDSELADLTTENALSFLEQRPWYLYGGSYFDSTGKLGNGAFKADL